MGLRKPLRRWIRNRLRKSTATDFSFSPFVWVLDRPPTGQIKTVTSNEHKIDDTSLVVRIMDAYKRANEGFVISDSFWDGSILNLNQDIHDALSGEDKAAAAYKLRHPEKNTHFWGFDAIAEAPKGTVEPHQHLLEELDPHGDWREQLSIWTFDKLITLANAVGAKKLHYPESPRKHPHADADEVLDKIEEKLGIKLEFPNPYAGEFGLETSRGVVSFRALQALYQSWRIAEISAGREDFKVLEIGAGLGRTAYFANKLGVKDYTIIDIPMTGAAQSYFLGRTLGENAVSLFGEETVRNIKIVPSSALKQLPLDFDLIVNVDSMTEMAADTMLEYWSFITRATPNFLSINHDENDRSVSELYSDNVVESIRRHPYWMRRGYVEEYVKIKPRQD